MLAVFAARLLNGRSPPIYEDGEQRRDFVCVHDVVQAVALALEQPGAAGRVLNVGSGRDHSVREIAGRVACALGRAGMRPRITGKYRVGDIRHCFADITLARNVLGYRPRVPLEEGLAELTDWLEGQVVSDRVEEASAELTARGLAI